MDLPTVTPETKTVSETVDVTRGIEETPISETFSDTPIVVNNPTADDSVDDTVQLATTSTFDPMISAEVTKEEIDDLADSNIEKADINWIEKVEDIIREDKDKPYKEVEDAEELNEEYMKERFNIDVDAPVEEK